METTTVDDAFAQFSGIGTAYLRALESTRADRLINDPFADVLTRDSRGELEQRLSTDPDSLWVDMVAIRTRYVNEALAHRDATIHQIVFLGAGLDTRAYYLESLRDCHVLEIDQGSQPFDRKREVMKAEQVLPITKKLDYIVAHLAEDDWDSKLRGHGFDPRVATFWVMEGLLPYMERSAIWTLLDTIDAMSAPGSTLWADMAGQAIFTFADMGDRAMKHSEDDPMRGVLSQIPWCLKLQASLVNAGTHFGRSWPPLASTDGKRSVPIPISFLIGQKPVPTEAREKDVCPGLEA
ncbi:hypothetical protein KRP22_003605 [Phytophthora ramorum]|uniref:putative S-adenosyl-L-methionine-dependent methyltransferase n=1 Tax=Phytophthora ramorum TaxID=164328 RepID=UPI00309ADAA7|nr:putative S-adenosyl-L-methionine-dependent methyltransferase [Phytophthora ramorum]KAH7500281.1 putative S-adenosyl-L-methionine-dependent methyltransferase [Phytophthora ramorum]